MKLSDVSTDILDPGLALLPLAMDSVKARCWMLTIGLQESKFEHRFQLLDDPTKKGPARGFWQFERGGGVKGVMTHPNTVAHAHRACAELAVPWDALTIWTRLEIDDRLACVFARLLLYADSFPLPEVGNYDAGWDLYAKRTWRPGKPHRSTWNTYHDRAREALGV